MSDLTLDEIRDIAQTLRNDTYAGRFSEFARDQMWYDQAIELSDLFPNFEQTDKLDPVVLPFAETYINSFTDHMVNSSRRVVPYVNPRQVEKSGEDKAVQFATLRGELLGFFHERTNRNTEGIRPDRDTAKFLGLRGMAIKELTFDREQHERTGFGFDIVAHDPWTVLPDPRARNKQFIIREFDTTLAEVWETWGHESDLHEPLQLPEFSGESPTRLVGVTQYIDKDAFIFVVGNEMVQIPNDFGFLPYVFGFNGLGLSAQKDEQSDDMGMGLPGIHDRFALESRSLLKPIHNVMSHAVRMDTSLWEAIKQSIFPFGLAINMEEEEFTVEAGTLTPVTQDGQTNEDIQWRPRPPIDPNVWSGIARHQGWMDRFAGSQVLQGQSERTISSGMEFESRLQQARLTFGEASEAFIGMDIGLGWMLQRYIEKHHLTTTVAFQTPTLVQERGSRTVKGADLDGFYDHNITLLAPGQEQIDFQRLVTRIQLSQAPGPGPTMEWALADQPGIDPKDMLRRKQLEAAKFSPAVMQVLAQHAANELNIALQEMQGEAEMNTMEDRMLDSVTQGVQAGEEQAFNETNIQRQLASTMAQAVPGQGNAGRPIVGPTTGANANA